jgi:hypothetical protein
VKPRLAALKITETLQSRRAGAIIELDKLIEYKQDFPAVYNHYYTDNVQKARQARMSRKLRESIQAATSHESPTDCSSKHTSAIVDVHAAAKHFQGEVDRDMVQHSCEEVLDSLLSMYKVSASRHSSFVYLP